MSTDLLVQKEGTIKGLLEAQLPAIADALPKHLDASRLMRLMTTEFRRNPALQECSPTSFVGALLQCAQVGLEPGPQGHVYLVPYRNKGVLEVQFQTGYKGLLELLNRTGLYHAPDVRAVYEGDEFVFEYGLNEKLVHRPKAKPGAKLTHVYLVIRPKDGGHPSFEVMSKEEVDKVRARSKSGGSGPWQTDYEAMAKKTVIRRRCKTMPASVQMQQAIAFDERDEIEVASEVAQEKANKAATVLGLVPSKPTLPSPAPEPSPAPQPEPAAWGADMPTGVAAPELPMQDDGPGSYVVPFGKENKGKRLDQCEVASIEKTRNFLYAEQTKGSPLSSAAVDFLAASAHYLNWKQGMGMEDVP